MNKGFAWLAFIAALIAGAGLASNNASLVQLLIVVVMVAALVIDIGRDREPNQAAVVVAVTLPSLLVGMDGGMANMLDGWLDGLWGWAAGPLGRWAGTESTLVIAIVAVALSFMIARSGMRRSATLTLGGGGGR